MDPIWNELYAAAKAVQNDRKLSNYVEAGGVAAAILSASGRIYTGVCADTYATLGIMPDGRTGAPCGACRELMVQLMPDKYRGIESILELEQRRTVTLAELTPEWWI